MCQEYKKGNTGRLTTTPEHYVAAGQMTQIDDSFKISIEPLPCPCWKLQISDLAVSLIWPCESMVSHDRQVHCHPLQRA